MYVCLALSVCYLSSERITVRHFRSAAEQWGARLLSPNYPEACAPMDEGKKEQEAPRHALPSEDAPVVAADPHAEGGHRNRRLPFLL